MAQSAVTVRLDPEMKAQFDKLCAEFGMSVNTAFNIFVNAVVRKRKIPFPVFHHILFSSPLNFLISVW